jgi:hypothetical protein
MLVPEQELRQKLIEAPAWMLRPPVWHVYTHTAVHAVVLDRGS